MAVAEVFVAETGSMLSEIENDEKNRVSGLRCWWRDWREV